jgi:peptidyl-prolyl cis-trans isomerase C
VIAKCATGNEGLKTLVFYFLSCISVVLSGCFSQERVVLNKTVLTVNGTHVSTQAFAERLALRLKNYDALYAKDESNLERAKEDTVQAFILEIIARGYADKAGIGIEKQELDTAVNEIQSRYPDELAFRRALADENMAFEKWRSDLEFTLLQKKIFSKITEKLEEPKDSELKEYYDSKKPEFQQPARVRLRQVVLEKEDDAKRIMDELSSGASLEKLAKDFSVAPESANGGDTGWLEKGTLEVFDQAFKMNVGTRSKILKSPYGYHIFEVLKKEPEGRLSFQDAKAKIRARLMEAKAQKAFTAWLEEQVRKSSVQRNDTLIRAIKVTTRGS